MPSVTVLAEALTEILVRVPDVVARQTGCIQRQRLFSGATLVQTLVLGWLATPDATLDELAQMAAAAGVRISAQGLNQRFTPALAATLEQVLAAAVRQVLGSDPVAVPLLARFRGVWIEDCSTISLPAAVAERWPGCGGRSGQGVAALKLDARLDLLHGTLDGPYLASGRTHDRAVAGLLAPLAADSLWIADLGFVTLARLRTIARQGGYWLTRLAPQTQVLTADGQAWTQQRLLATQTTDQVELEVRLGRAARLPARLLAIRVPAAVAEERRTRLRATATRKQRAVSAARLELAAWTIYVTNVPAALLSLAEAAVLARARWQIELLWKLWKQHGQVDVSRSQQPQRILCEIYAKLTGVVIQHWLLLTAAWTLPGRSLVKAARVVRAHVLGVLISLGSRAKLRATLRTLRCCLMSGTRINARRQAPNTFQLLLDPTLAGLT
jgi:hypothetical protein